MVDYLTDTRVAWRRARAILADRDWGDLRADCVAKAYHDAALACVVEALQTAHLSDREFAEATAARDVKMKIARAIAAGADQTESRFINRLR